MTLVFKIQYAELNPWIDHNLSIAMNEVNF